MNLFSIKICPLCGEKIKVSYLRGKSKYVCTTMINDSSKKYPESHYSIEHNFGTYHTKIIELPLYMEIHSSDLLVCHMFNYNDNSPVITLASPNNIQELKEIFKRAKVFSIFS